jgi:hypothetical protein
LRPVEIRESAGLPSWMERSGFEDRRKMGLGAFMTEEEVKRHNFSELVEVLQGVRGIRVNFCNCPGVMGVPVMLGNGRTCSPNFFLDGILYPVGFSELSGFVPVGQIKGIEVYSSAGTVPLQYDKFSQTGCGSIVLWTR